MATTKRNPQEATRRNVQASIKRDAKLAEQIAELEAEINDIKLRLDLIETGRTKRIPSNVVYTDEEPHDAAQSGT